MQTDLLSKYADQGFQLIGINVGYEPAGIMESLQEAGITVPVAFDLESELFRRVRVPGWVFPLNVLFDRQGKLILIQTEEDFDALDAAIGAALG